MASPRPRPGVNRRFRALVGRGLRRVPRRARARVVRGLQRSYYAYLALRNRDGIVTMHRGLPVPPARFRVLVSHRDSKAGDFLRSGQGQAQLLEEIVNRNGLPMQEMGAFLDFGCGCGRVARWWADLRGPSVHGCDRNPELVKWCSESLTFMDATVNDLGPPLPYDAGQFDFVYALSVFIHMPEELETLWMSEFRRVLRPGGLLWLTVHGDRQHWSFAAAEREEFERGGRMTRFPELAGTNMCGAFHSPRFVETRMLEGFEVEERRPGGEWPFKQDGYLARRLSERG
jgi:SAM-dependent methyltransferase